MNNEHDGNMHMIWTFVHFSIWTCGFYMVDMCSEYDAQYEHLDIINIWISISGYYMVDMWSEYDLQ